MNSPGNGDGPFGQWEPYFNNAVVRGRRMRYLDVGAGPPVLLVHGLGASWRVWTHNLSALMADYRLIVVDLPGFGDSQNLASPIEVDDYAQALAGLMSALNLNGAVVVGHSLGGLISQRLAARYPDEVSALVLVSTTGSVVGALARALFQIAAVSTVPLALVPRALMTPAMRRAVGIPALRRWLLGHMVHDPDRVSQDVAVDMLASAFSSAGTASAIRAGLRVLTVNDPGVIRCPVLILSGDEDRITTVDAADDLRRRIPQAKQVTLSGVGHHPMWEKPTQFDDLLCGFMRELELSA
jgi:pimeloyl-ACP methyl ester carboxylesterase